MFALEGTITFMTIPWLFQDIRKGRKTGIAVFESNTGTIKVFFRHGDIISASSNSDNTAMGEHLLRTGKITQHQLEKSSDIMTKTGKRLGVILFELGALTPQDLVDQAAFQVKQNILSLFTWAQGKYHFEDGILSSPEFVPIQMSTPDLIIEGVKGLDWQNIRQSLPPLNTIVRKSADPSPLFQIPMLDPTERIVNSFVDGKASIQDICDMSTLGDLKTLTSVYVLLALRLIEQVAMKEQDEREFLFQEERATVAPIKYAADGESTSDGRVNREILQNAYDSLDLQDYFDILGVSHRATTQQIKKAYFSLSKLYHPDRYAESQFADMKPKLQALFESVNEAYEVLSDKDKRDQYNLDLASGIKKYGQEERQVPDKKESIKSAATFQFNEGMKQFRVQNFWGAEEAFRGAVRLDPSKAEYIFYQGLAVSHLPRRSHEAEECFVKAIRLAPANIEYQLELGNFFAKLGLKEKALQLYQNALRRDPNSEKVKQAIKNLAK